MNETQFREAVEFFLNRESELSKDQWHELGKPEFMDTTAIHEQALKEAWEVHNG